MKMSFAHLQLKEVFRWEGIPRQELHVCTDIRACELTSCSSVLVYYNGANFVIQQDQQCVMAAAISGSQTVAPF